MIESKVIGKELVKNCLVWLLFGDGEFVRFWRKCGEGEVVGGGAATHYNVHETAAHRYVVHSTCTY